MSTTAQIIANRENATHSTGPITDAGRATCSMNGLKHGLSTSQLIIPGESEEEFNTFLAELQTEHQPTTTTETLLVQDMAKYHWLADRALRMQNYAIAREGNEVPKTLAILIRYHTANERAFQKSFASLNASRKTRLAEIGSASQKASAPAPEAAPPKPATEPPMEEILEMVLKGYFYNFATGEYDHDDEAKN
jgi:hypothetical protein